MPHGAWMIALIVTLCRASVRAAGPNCTSASGLVESCTRLVVSSSTAEAAAARAFDSEYHAFSCTPSIHPAADAEVDAVVTVLDPMLMFIVGFAGFSGRSA